MLIRKYQRWMKIHQLIKPSESDKEKLQDFFDRYCQRKSRSEAFNLLFEDFCMWWPEQILEACGIDPRSPDKSMNWILTLREAENEYQYSYLLIVEELFAGACCQAGLLSHPSFENEGIKLVTLADNP